MTKRDLAWLTFVTQPNHLRFGIWGSDPLDLDEKTFKIGTCGSPISRKSRDLASLDRLHTWLDNPVGEQGKPLRSGQIEPETSIVEPEEAIAPQIQLVIPPTPSKDRYLGEEEKMSSPSSPVSDIGDTAYLPKGPKRKQGMRLRSSVRKKRKE